MIINVWTRYTKLIQIQIIFFIDYDFRINSYNNYFLYKEMCFEKKVTLY